VDVRGQCVRVQIVRRGGSPLRGQIVARERRTEQGGLASCTSRDVFLRHPQLQFQVGQPADEHAD